jgi:hypothetical protein
LESAQLLYQLLQPLPHRSLFSSAYRYKVAILQQYAGMGWAVCYELPIDEVATVHAGKHIGWQLIFEPMQHFAYHKGPALRAVHFAVVANAFHADDLTQWYLVGARLCRNV